MDSPTVDEPSTFPRICQENEAVRHKVLASAEVTWCKQIQSVWSLKSTTRKKYLKCNLIVNRHLILIRKKIKTFHRILVQRELKQ